MIITDPSHLQRQASSPQTSVWVDASAGTGKTKVLTDRVLRLLLGGTPPSKILCLTFTKAAAAEMQARIMENLSTWSTLSKENLKVKLQDLLGAVPSSFDLHKAQHLFFDILDDPYGLKVQTIHGFCQTLLSRFPIEAGVDATAKVISDQDQQAYLQEVQKTFLQTLDENPVVKSAFINLSSVYKPSYILETAMSLVQNPHFKIWADSQSENDFQTFLKTKFDLSFHHKDTDILRTLILDHKGLQQAILALKTGSKTDQQKAETLIRCLESGITPPSFQDLFALFFTKDKLPRKTLATKKVLSEHPWLQAVFEQTLHAVQACEEKLSKLKAVHMSHALSLLGRAYLSLYKAIKISNHALDYDDLITKSAHLLSLHQGVSWVLYKLDGGLDHILVDEAQDTSPDQWQIILKLAEDFFTGESARIATRTLFVVGDRKQSIYGFQGAEPDLFLHLRSFFEDKIKAAKQSWSSVALTQSFRSSPPIMNLVEAVFEQPDLCIQDTHHSFFHNRPGRVSLWPLESYQDTVQSPAQFEISASQRLAEKIATDISHRLQGSLQSLSNKSYSPSDFMIMVQRRSSLMYQIIRALKKKNIQVAGPDRFALLDHIVAQDLIALGQFVACPQDDYTLACVLKSPLFHGDDDDLMTLSQTRHTHKDQSLFETLKSHRPTIHETLSSWIIKSRSSAVYEFYESIIRGAEKWADIRTRFEQDADDVVQEFLMVAHEFDQDTGGSLQEFCETLKKSQHIVKRDFSGANLNAVRIMTVHGAKGLQAPVVYLPDTVRVPNDPDVLRWVSHQGVAMPLWRGACLPEGTLPEDDLDEYYRLLYVALTRAESELIISGFETAKQTDDRCWYRCIQRAFNSLPHMTDPLQRLVMKTQETRFTYKPNHTPIPSKPICPNIPEWARSKVPIEIGDADPLSPSGFYEAYMSTDSQAPTKNQEPNHQDLWVEGIQIHSILRDLLRTQPQEWQGITAKYTKTAKDNYVIARALVDHPKFADLTSRDLLTEVPLIGRIDVSPLLPKHPQATQKFSGQIDALKFEDNTITIIDFKTGLTPISSLETVPKSYLVQLYIYAQLVQSLYPEKRIACDFIDVRHHNRFTASPDTLLNLLTKKVL